MTIDSPSRPGGRVAAGRFRRRRAEAVPLAASPFILETPAPAAVRRRDALSRRALLAADTLAAVVSVGAVALAVGGRGPGAAALLLVAIVPVVFTTMGLYRRDELVLSTNTLDEAPVVFQAATLSAVAAHLGASALVATPLGAQLILAGILSLAAAALVLRGLARAAARRVVAPERCLLIGGADSEGRLAAKLESGPAVNARLVGRLGLGPENLARDLARTVAERDVHRVLVAGEGAPAERVHEAIQAAKALGVKVSVLPRMFEVVGSTVAFDYLGGMTVLGVRRFGLARRQRTVKRAFDLTGALLLLVAFAPVMAVLALAVRLGSSGPVLFRQTRVGRDGRHFEVLKFRSMVADAEARKAALRQDAAEDGLFKLDDDPRVTRVGRLLRRTSLDELPQLINVVRGEMSIVGPRPLVVDEDQRIEGFYRRRLDLTPGMTGPWQVLGSARIPLREMASIDYLYVADWSLWEDVKILLRTIPCVVGARGR